MDTLVLALLDVVVTATGKVAIFILTLGRLRTESLDGTEGSIHGGAGAFWFTRDGKVVVTCTGQLFAGVATWIAAIGGLLFAAAV